MISWQSCSKYKAVPGFPFLTCNAAAGIVHIWSCQITISIDILQMHDGVSITPHTVPLSCHAFHYCTAEDGVLIAKTKMSNRGMITARLPSLLHRIYMIDNILNETGIPGTSLLMYTYSGPLSQWCYVVRCSNKVHNQENTSARVYHLASEHVR